jgi:hypothetical protein
MEDDLEFLVQMDKVGEPFGNSLYWLSYEDFCRLSELLKNTEHPMASEIKRIADKVDYHMGVLRKGLTGTTGLVARLGSITLLR